MSRLLGGRPMMLTEGLGFRDRVSGKEVGFYIDSRGRYWMATSRWSWFRVRAWTAAEEAHYTAQVLREQNEDDDED